jgi:16S rRNA processing protein RimM
MNVAPAETPFEPPSLSDWVSIARIETTHGRFGELKAEMLTDFPERFRAGLPITLARGDKRRAYTLENSWLHKGSVILKLQGLDTMSEAEQLRDWLVQVPRSERHPLPEDRYYLSDLLGFSVLQDGEFLGRVTGWQETGAVPLLEAGEGAHELLIPFTQEICRAVDQAKREIHVVLPEGLRELNPASAATSKSKRR